MLSSTVVTQRAPTMRHVPRVHRVGLDTIWERISNDPSISVRHVNTKQQMADILTKESFTKHTFDELSSLVQVGKSYPRLQKGNPDISAVIRAKATPQNRKRVAQSETNKVLQRVLDSPSQGHIKERSYVTVVKKVRTLRSSASIKAELTQLLNPAHPSNTKCMHKAYVCKLLDVHSESGSSTQFFSRQDHLDAEPCAAMPSPEKKKPEKTSDEEDNDGASAIAEQAAAASTHASAVSNHHME